MAYYEPPDIRSGKALKHQAVSERNKHKDNIDKRQTLIGYRYQSPSAIRSGRSGTFYTVSPQGRGDKPFTLKFKNLLELSNKNVEAFYGLPAEYLASQWFPDTNWRYEAEKHNVIETGHAMDIEVARESIKKGYDGIKDGDFEIQDLRSLMKQLQTKNEFQNNDVFISL